MSEKQLFQQAVELGMSRARSVLKQRGEEYKDSWRNSEHTLLRSTLRMQPEQNAEKKTTLCLLTLAALIDVKISRLNEGFKEDTLIDLVNYISAYLDMYNYMDMDANVMLGINPANVLEGIDLIEEQVRRELEANDELYE